MQHQARVLLRPSSRTDSLFVALILAFFLIMGLSVGVQAADPEPVCYLDLETGEWLCFSWIDDHSTKVYLPLVAQ